MIDPNELLEPLALAETSTRLREERPAATLADIEQGHPILMQHHPTLSGLAFVSRDPPRSPLPPEEHGEPQEPRGVEDERDRRIRGLEANVAFLLCGLARLETTIARLSAQQHEE